MASHLLQAYRCFILGFICLLSLSSSIPIGIVVTVEEPFIQQTTARLDSFGIETFDRLRPRTYDSYHTDFNQSDYQGIYYDLDIRERDIYGGAGGTGFYPAATTWSPCRLVLTRDGKSGANYFGFWWSAINELHRIVFHYKKEQVFTLRALEILNLLQGRRDYWGNPTYDPRRHMEEPFAFVNVYLNTTRIDEIEFYQNPNFWLSSDNHIFGHYTDAEFVSTTTTASTVITTATASQVVQNITSPAVETTACQVVKTTTASPAIKSTTRPVVETTTRPVITAATASPAVITTASPAVESTTRPVVETTSRPVVETTARPVVETTARPVVETITSTVITAATASPAVITTTTSSVIKSTTSSATMMAMTTVGKLRPGLVIGAAAGGILGGLTLVGGVYAYRRFGVKEGGIQREPTDRETRISIDGQSYA